MDLGSQRSERHRNRQALRDDGEFRLRAIFAGPIPVRIPSRPQTNASQAGKLPQPPRELVVVHDRQTDV